MPEALANSLGRLPIELSAAEMAEIVIRREQNARKRATSEAAAEWKAHDYQENWRDLIRLAHAITFGRKGG